MKRILHTVIVTLTATLMVIMILAILVTMFLVWWKFILWVWGL